MARRLLLPVLAVLAFAGLTACSSGSKGGAADGKVAVVTSTDVYASLVRAVGGDRVSVTALLDDPSIDPHEYEPSAADGAAVGKAAVVIANGGGYDPFFERLTAGSKAKVLDAVVLSGIKAPAGGELNEHVWYDLPAMQELVGALATALAQVDPPGADAYRTAAAATTGKLDALIQRTEQLKAKAAGAEVAITEPVANHLFDSLGLTVATPDGLSEAIENGSDAPAADLATQLELLRSKRVKLLAYNAQTETAVTKQIRQTAERAGVPVVEVRETLPAGQSDYLAWMSSQIDAVAAALS